MTPSELGVGAGGACCVRPLHGRTGAAALRHRARGLERAVGSESKVAEGLLVARVHRRIVERGDDLVPGDHEQLRHLVQAEAPLSDPAEVDRLIVAVGRRLFGLGPLDELLELDGVSEIMVNGPGRVWVEQAGEIRETDIAIDEAALQVVIERILAPLGLRIDRSSPLVDARLSDGSRVHIAVPPLALDGVCLTIRRFGHEIIGLDRFAGPDVVTLLRAAVHARLSMVVSGGTGSGKTSLLNALAREIDPRERVITIEDAAELRLGAPHVVRLEARPANTEGVGEITIRTLVRNALRMRPDRLVIGEVRGAEAFDMVQAMNTGHEGSLSTCHANTARDAWRRLESLVLMGDVELPLSVVRDLLRSAIGLMIAVERAGGGRRRITTVRGPVDDAEPLVHGGVLTASGRDQLAAWRPVGAARP